MKKIFSSILAVLVFTFLCSVTSASMVKIEELGEKLTSFGNNSKKSTPTLLSLISNNDSAEIHNAVIGPILDNDRDQFYSWFQIYVDVDVPDGSALVKVRYYYSDSSSEGEWIFLYESESWYLLEGEDTAGIKFTWAFDPEHGGLKTAGKIFFKLELYTDDGVQQDYFPKEEGDYDIWLYIEAEEYDQKDGIPDPPPPTCNDGGLPTPTPTPIITPTPTPVVVGMIYGTVTDEEGNPLPKAKVKLESTDVKKRTKTDANGWYSFEELGLNTNYNVSATAEGYSKGITSVYLREDEPEKETNFILRKK